MLILSRTTNETIEIKLPTGETLGRITVVDIKGPRCRLGLDFPRDYRIMRTELKHEDKKGDQA